MNLEQKILVVDDEKEVADIISAILNKSGFKCDACYDYYSAISHVKESPYGYELIVTDINMPKRSGIDLIDSINKLKEEGVISPHIRYIAITGQADVSVAMDLYEKGLYDFLTKPFRQEILVNLVKKFFKEVSFKKSPLFVNSLENIVFADDEAEVRFVVKEMLQRLGYNNLTICKSGNEVIKVLENIKPDLLITDINLGDISGLDILKKARFKHPELPVILLTGYESLSYVKEAIKNNAFHYLTKPVSMETLAISVSNSLQKKYITSNNCKTPSNGEGKVVSLVGPWCVGKSTIMQALKNNPELNLEMIVKYTTREPRPGEKDGVDFNYITKEKFKKLVAEGKIIGEYEVNNELYGFPSEITKTGPDKNYITVASSYEGYKKLRANFPDSCNMLVFTRTEDLIRRLEERKCSKKEKKTRLSKIQDNAKEFYKHFHSFDYYIYNRNPNVYGEDPKSEKLFLSMKEAITKAEEFIKYITTNIKNN